MLEFPEIKQGKYRHYKGTYYHVVGVAKHSETLEDLVIYFDEKKHFWVRPYRMFSEKVIVDGVTMPRFEFVE